MPPHELQTAIVELVNRPDYQPVKPRVIAKRLGLAEGRSGRGSPRGQAAGEAGVGELRRESYCAARHIRRLTPSARLTPPMAAWPLGHSPTTAVRPRSSCRQRRGNASGANTSARGSWAYSIAHGRVSASCGRLPHDGEEGSRRTKEVSKDEDIFIPAKYTLDAAGGDVVAVEVKRAGAVGGPVDPAPAAASWKSSNGRRGSSSAPISSRKARPTCRSMARSSPSRSTSAIPARRTPGPTIRWSSR